MNRYTRQIRLPEIGEAGQAKLAQGRALVCAHGLEGEIERRYLKAAGVGEIAASDAPPIDVPFDLHDAHARAVAHGAWRALRQMRQILGLSP